MKKWILEEKTKERQKGISQLKKEQADEYDFSDPMIEYLYNREVRTLEDIHDITEISRELEKNPLELKDVEKAADIISDAVDRNHKIMVFGDYDTDGVSAVTVMVRALRNIGGDVDYFVNDRFKHGFGINKKAIIDMIAEKGKPDLLVTVDNGIVGFEGVEYAVNEGIKVVITDHHIADETLPRASAVVNPNRLDEDIEFPDISGAAVAYKVMLVLYYQRELDFQYLYDMHDIVALSTVGDVMPLKDENRWFVKQGLKLIGEGRRPQFKAIQQAKQGDRVFDLNADLFGFTISPMMNAPGRLIGKPDIAIDFFLSDDESEINRLAEKLVEVNEERKELAASQVEIAESVVDVESSNVIVAYHPDFHQGIIGLIAGRLTEKYNKPAIAFSDAGDGVIKGSARTIPSYPIKNALDRVAEHIIQYGGHDGAAGLSIKKSKLEDFVKALGKDAGKLSAEDLVPEVHVDALLDPEDITQELVGEMQSLRPFGEGFRAPLFGMNTMPVHKTFYMTEGKHVKLIGKNKLTVLMFNGGEQVRSMGDIKIVQAVGTPSLNTWRGVTNVQFMVHDDCLAGK